MKNKKRNKDDAKAHRFADASTGFEDGMARICRLYGVSPLMGRLYAVLFLAAQPVTLEDLCARVGAAKSTVSVALRKLASARVVRRLPSRGDRRDYYESVSDPWTILQDWTRLFFEPEMAMWRETGTALDDALTNGGDAPKGDAKIVLRERIERMRDFLASFEQLLGATSSARPPAPPARRIRIETEAEDES